MNAIVTTVFGVVQNSNLAAAVLDASVKSFAVLGAAGLACLCCRRAPAATRHLLWVVALTGLILLPLVSTILPAWHKPIWSVSADIRPGNEVSLLLELAAGKALAPIAQAPEPGSASRTVVAGKAVGQSQKETGMRLNGRWLEFGFAIWLMGVVWILLRIAIGRFQIHLLSRQARLLQDGDWTLLAKEACVALALKRTVRLMQGAENLMPMTWGWWRPVVLMPRDADGWPAERRRVVLLHELAHIKRWDCLTQMAARMVCAFYWFNPLVWVAARQMCIERERACDDLVLKGGWEAANYATHLVEIARSFRRAPQAAAIGIARPSGLQQRIAAILDGRRNRSRMSRSVALTITLTFLGVEFLIGANVMKGINKDWSLEHSIVAQELKRFVAEKKAQASAAAAEEGKEMMPEFKSLFAAAEKGDWLTISNIFEDLRKRAPQYSDKGPKDERCQGIQWSAVLEVWGAFEDFALGGEKYVAAFGRETIASIPARSIFFGGNDAGRFVITALCKSHVKGDPFFTLTQNALVDGSYLKYLRSMYANSIYIPSDQDSTNSLNEYLEDAQRRLTHDRQFPNERRQVKPGEDVREVDGKQLYGQVAVMAVNALLSKLIFDKNPKRDFYVEESFPLDWMYPHLSPHGLIMKINRDPLAELTNETVQKDHEFWTAYIKPILGDWLNYETSVQEIVSEIRKRHVDHDLSGFTGDPQFLENEWSQKLFSKLRSSIAGIYAWRALHGRPDEKQRMSKEADFGFRQAFALCPSSPEAVYRYINLLVGAGRLDDSILVAQAAGEVKRDDNQLKSLLTELYRMKDAQKK